MNYEIINVQQGTEEWLDARKGVVTGTGLDLVMKEGRGGKPSAQRLGYIYELIGGQTAIYNKADVKTAAMERGNIAEEAIKELDGIQSVGFIKRTDIPWLGISPDGVEMNENGEIVNASEIKTPEPKAYVQYAIENPDSVPDKYYWQVVHYFIVIDTLQSLDFITQCPEMQDERCRKHKVTVTRDMLAEDIKRAQEAL